MDTETYLHTKYNTYLSLDKDEDDVIRIKVVDNASGAIFECILDMIPDDVNILPIIQKCLMREQGYLISYNTSTKTILTVNFMAYLGGFVKIEFSAHLIQQNIKRDFTDMKSRILVQAKSAPNGDLVPAKKPNKDYRVIYDTPYVENTPYVKGYMENKDAITELKITSEHHIINWENIQHTSRLVKLEIDSLSIDFREMKNNNLRNLTLSNCYLATMEGIQGFPKLTILIMEGCSIPPDFTEVLANCQHNIKTIEIQQCSVGDTAKIEKYCASSGIHLII